MKKISSFLFLVFCFLLPFNLKIALYTSPQSLVVLDYTTFFLYPAEIILFLSFLLLPKDQLRTVINKKDMFLIMLFFLVILPSFLFSPDPFLSSLLSIRILEFFLVLYLLHRHIRETLSILAVLGISLFLQGLLAMGQYWYQGSLGFGLLGESIFTVHSVNTAKIDFLGEKIIRGYGTFAHPNILGGFLMTGIICFLLWKESLQQKLSFQVWLLLMGGMLLGLFFTFSRSALLGLFIGMAVMLLLKKRRQSILPALTGTLFTIVLLSCLFPFAVNRFQESTTENTTRLQEYQQGIQNLAKYPLGSGLGTSLVVQERNLRVSQAQWQLQPTHNFFMETALELGILAGILVFSLFLAFLVRMWSSAQRPLLGLALALSLPLMTDHYFLTSFAGIMLLGLIVGIILRQTKRGAEDL